MKYMKLLKNTLIFTLSVQVMIAPLNQSIIGVQSALAEDSESCSEQGKVLDSATGRCVLPKQVVTAKSKASGCEELSGEAYASCFKKNAEDSREDLELKNNDKVSSGNWHKYSVPIMASLIAGYYLLQNQSKLKQCSATSMWLILGGAASGMITELTAQRSYKKKLKSLLKSYKENVSEAESTDQESADKNTEAQTLALEMMAEQEKARKKAASSRKKGHTLAMAMYGAAAVVALYEQYQYGSGGNCMSGEDATSTGASEEKSVNLEPLWLDKNFKAEFEEYSYLNKVSIREFVELVTRKIYQNVGISSAHAQLPEMGEAKSADFFAREAEEAISVSIAKPEIELDLSGIQTSNTADAFSGGEEAIKHAGNSEFGASIKKWVNESLSTPWVRGALAGTLAVYAKSLVDSAKKNEKIANERIEAIGELVADFTSSGGATWASCSEKERSNPQVPACYCYNEDGSVNQQRVTRQSCVSYSASVNVSPTKYSGLGSSGYTPVKACFKDGGEVDEGCQVCKKQPKRCPAIAKAAVGNLSLGGSLGMTDLVEQSNSLATGRLSTSDLNSASLQRMAANIDKAKDKLANKNKKAKSIADKMAKLQTSFNKAAPGLLRKSFGNKPPALASLGGAGSVAMPASLKGNSKVQEAVNNLNKGALFQKGQSLGAKSSKKEDDFDFGFDDASAGGVALSDDGHSEGDTYKIKGDIHKNSSHNLFQILSLRYQRSGLRRLFDTDGRSKADSASESLINKK